jgi:cell wall-associated NlpC family hydrolase
MGYKHLLGIPFRYGGRDETGLDCYGLVLAYYRAQGRELPDYAGYDAGIVSGASDPFLARSTQGPWEVVRGEPQVGDIVTLARTSRDRNATHCAVCVERNRILHAVEGWCVTTTPLRPLRSRIRGVYRPCRA